MGRIVVDTGVFYYPAALEAIKAVGGTVVAPVIVVLERARQMERDGRGTILDFKAALDLSHFDIEPFGFDEAARAHARVRGLTEVRWAALARDAMVAGHVRDGDTLWTTNPKDFRTLGLGAHQIRVAK